MDNLTLIIPAKNERESLPHVLNELKELNLKIVVVLEKQDIETINSIKNYNCKILKQSKKGYGNALIELGETDINIVVLGADTTDSLKTSGFGKNFPDLTCGYELFHQQLFSVSHLHPLHQQQS